MRTPDTQTDTLELLDTFRQCLPDPLSDSYQKAKLRKSLKDSRLVQMTGTTQNRFPEMAKTKDEQSLFPVLNLSKCNVNFRKNTYQFAKSLVSTSDELRINFYVTNF